jgi:sulfoxide reductase heme-binding subunit YedZ
MTSPMLWYLNRGTGAVLLALYTMAVVGGVLATGRRTSSRWPRFVTQGLHRTLGLLASVLLAVHAASAVVDEFVDIRWWHALVPFGGLYQPVFLALGALALDLTVAIAVTSALRSRLSVRLWHAVHLTSYVGWAVAVAHTVGIGTDMRSSWLPWLLGACVAAVVAAAGLRVARSARGDTPHGELATQAPDRAVGMS